jgi:two-component system, OmpR family, response regulator RpaA
MKTPLNSFSSSSNHPIILIVDDDPQIAETISLRLGAYDVEVLAAYHGMHGFGLALSARPDLVITDLRMPQGEGAYVVERLKNNPDTRQIPVIVLTGQRDPKLENQMRALGIQEYCLKPMRFEELRKKISKYIELVEADAEEVRLELALECG